ncbi:MAG: hypothetical protein AAFU79_06855 [Myxococcota bacterium]
MIWLLPLSLLTANPHAASEEEELKSTMHLSPHTESSSWLVGLKGLQLTEFPPEGESLVGGGVGVFAETTLVHGWLELEGSLSLARVSGVEEAAWVVPVDLLVKKPFHSGLFCPYIAVGPTVAFEFLDEHEGTETLVGGAVVVGAYIWLSDWAGIDLEVDYAAVANGGVQHELTFAAGPTLRL